MFKRLIIACGIIICAVAAVFAIRAASGSASRAALHADAKLAAIPVAAESARTSPGDRLLLTAQSVVERLPSEPGGYNLLAAAYMQKVRETGDFGLNAKAEAALDTSLKVAPDNYDALKLRSKLLLTFHRFPEALQAAQQAQSRNPRDHDVYGALTDALVELGDYAGAVEAAQRMVDLRPDTASYSRVSYLRQLHGDLPGAIEAMRTASQAASPADPEKLAWCLVQLGDALRLAGRRADAEREYDHALFTFPDYPAALAAKARARLASGETEAAVELYRRAEERVPLPDYAAALGDLYTKLGRTQEASRQYELVEFVERTGAAAGTYSRQLALFWADHDTRLDEALAVAERERTTRRDIYTYDLLAWCLYKKGRHTEARDAMNEALRLGTLDARLFYHAAMIADALGERQTAQKFLRQAAKLDASVDVLQSERVRRALSTTKAPTS